MDVSSDISNHLSKALNCVGVSNIVSVEEIIHNERIWEIIVTDETSSKYFLSLNCDGTLGVIYENSLDGKILYCEGRKIVY